MHSASNLCSFKIVQLYSYSSQTVHQRVVWENIWSHSSTTYDGVTSITWKKSRQIYLKVCHGSGLEVQQKEERINLRVKESCSLPSRMEVIPRGWEEEPFLDFGLTPHKRMASDHGPGAAVRSPKRELGG